MKKFITAAFVLSSLFAAPGIVVSEASAQAVCGPGVPEAWTRPGGFCDQRGGGTLVQPNMGCSSYEYIYPEIEKLSSVLERRDLRVHVAETCVIDCSDYYDEVSFDLRKLQIGDRARVADIPLGCQA